MFTITPLFICFCICIWCLAQSSLPLACALNENVISAESLGNSVYDFLQSLGNGLRIFAIRGPEFRVNITHIVVAEFLEVVVGYGGCHLILWFSSTRRIWSLTNKSRSVKYQITISSWIKVVGALICRESFTVTDRRLTIEVVVQPSRSSYSHWGHRSAYRLSFSGGSHHPIMGIVV